MWFWFSLIALICWSGSDLFSKIGCQDADDKYSHLKMVMAVGLVMGLHAAYEIFINGTEINGSIILTYLPVSLLYISSMTIGYIGLRDIDPEAIRRELAVTSEDGVAVIARHMNYGLYRVEGKSDCPRDALNICRMLSLKPEILKMVEESY